jgi:hypothetical protein
MENTSEMIFTELCEDSVYRPVAINPKKVTNIKKLADARHQDGNIGKYIAYTTITHDDREIMLFDSFENVLAALVATAKYQMYHDVGTRHIKTICEWERIRYQECRSPEEQ